MIFLTGDVHHKSMGGHDQKLMNCTEVEAAIKYAEIALKYNIKVTLYLTGRCFIEEPASVKKLIDMENVEIGGHTWNAFKYKNFHRLSSFFFSSYYGPSWYQKWDITKTIKIIEDFTGIKCISWRSHCYGGDAKTFKILFDNGIKIISDEINEKGKIKYIYKNLISLPINTITDELNIERGLKTKKNMIQRMKYIGKENDVSVYCINSKQQNKFINFIFYKLKSRIIKNNSILLNRRFLNYNQWFRYISVQIINNIKKNGFATIQAHPSIMEINNFYIFRQLLNSLKKYQSVKVKSLNNSSL